MDSKLTPAAAGPRGENNVAHTPHSLEPLSQRKSPRGLQRTYRKLIALLVPARAFIVFSHLSPDDLRGISRVGVARRVNVEGNMLLVSAESLNSSTNWAMRDVMNGCRTSIKTTARPLVLSLWQRFVAKVRCRARQQNKCKSTFNLPVRSGANAVPIGAMIASFNVISTWPCRRLPHSKIFVAN